jgi:pimeloyl-ACP methyl ester carboxylesterase
LGLITPAAGRRLAVNNHRIGGGKGGDIRSGSRRLARFLVLAARCTTPGRRWTCVCERSHLLTPDIDLDTHILDIVNEMKWQGLDNVVLVGHSYGGMVISGVAEKMEKSISSFVMLDAFMPQDGQAVLDLLSPPVREALLPAGHAAPTTLPPRSAAIFQRAGPRLGRRPMHAAAG